MKLKNLLIALLSLAAFSSCDMMKEDVDDSNCGLFITFKYDYNLQRADMFKDHVGGVTLYVFDSDGRFVRTYEENNNPATGHLPLNSYSYRMHITDLPDGQYQFIALAHQKSYESALATPGAKYRRTQLHAGDPMTQLRVELDREASRAAAMTDANPMVSNVAPLDTLWHGMSRQLVSVKNTGMTVDTISLMRDTKMLTISLHNLDADKRADIRTEEFDYFIVDNNGRLDYDNSLLADDDLVYTPFHKWDTFTEDAGGTVTEATAHAGLTFNRLIWYEEADRNALLIIRNRTTGTEVAAINLTDALAQGRNAYDQYAYSRQEYLDRSYDYYLDFFIRNGVWQSADVRINVLSWAKRIQNVDLH